LTSSELGIVVVGGLAGWWLVSWLIERRNPPPAAPSAAPPPAPALASAATESAAPPSVRELGDSWWTMLGVERGATLAEITASYQQRRAALERVRSSPTSTAADSDRAAVEQRAVEAAYEFIRASRADPG
jgi:hypothetical protein